MPEKGEIKAIDKTSIHRITSGQVVIDLQTAVKELVENSLDAGATNIEVRFKHHGLKSIEVIDNGFGIPEQYHESIALKHHTSKLSSFSDLATVRTFGFRGEALSSLCALSETLVVNTATEPPMGVSLEMEPSGKVGKRSKIARQRGTTVAVTNLFKPLPVRRKEFERNVKREFGKALALLNAYALIGEGVRLTVSNTVDKGQKTVQLRTSGASATRSAVSELWGPKALDNIIDLDLTFEVERDKTSLRRVHEHDVDSGPMTIVVKGLISKFTVGGGRTGTDRQFFYVNGRPCNLNKIHKAFNEVYRSFNANQAPFILANFIIPTDSCDINVSPDKRTIFLHSENNMVIKLKVALEETFSPSRSTYDVGTSQQKLTQGTLTVLPSRPKRTRSEPAVAGDGDEAEEQVGPNKKRLTRRSPSPSTEPRATRSEVGVSSIISSQSSLESSSGRHRPRSSPASADMSGPDQGWPERAISPTVSQMVDVGKRRKIPSSSPHLPARRSSPIRDPSPTVTQMLTAHRSSGDEGDAMDVDDDDNPEASSDPHDNSIVVDTSAAVWNRVVLRKETTAPGDKNVSKAGKLSIPSDSGTAGSKEYKAPLETTKARRDRMRNSLVGFARHGSHIPVTSNDKDNEDEQEEGASEDEQAEEGDVEVEVDLEGRVAQKGDATVEEDELNYRDSHVAAKPASPAATKVVNARPSELPPPVEVERSPGQSSTNAIDLTSEDGFDDSHLTTLVDETSSSLRHEEPISRPEVIRTFGVESEDISLRFDITKISDTWERRGADISSDLNVDPQSLRRVPSDAGVSNAEDDESAVKALARIIDKKDFTTMDIVGQFNLGFIVTRRRKTIREGAVMDDLFIVDQHAADEKYNFETLQQTTTINSQKLFRPQAMELTASDELIALENMDVLRQNGFEIEQIEEGDKAGSELRQGGRLRLTAQPVSKSTVFDMKDLEELIHLMRDRPTGSMVRCSKARTMFAMRACRKSVMVGMPLNKQQMSTVVKHMGTMDQPWNCPHGRPTMRHLLDISRSVTVGSRQDMRIDWNNPL